MKKLLHLIIVFTLSLLLTPYSSQAQGTINISIDTLVFENVASGESYRYKYTLSAENLTDDVVVSVPGGQGFRVSSVANNDSYSYTLSHTGGTIAPTNLYVKFAPIVEKDYLVNISHTSGNVTENLPVSGTGIGVGEVYIMTSTHEVDFGYVPVGGDSLISVDYKIINEYPVDVFFYYPEYFTNSSGGTWAYSSGMNSTVNVLFAPSDSGYFEGDMLINSSISQTLRYFHVKGHGIIPNISLDTVNFNFGDVLINDTSTVLSYMVNGSNLVNGIKIGVPYGFEISLTNDSNFANQIIIPEQNKEVNDVQVFVRFIPHYYSPYGGNIIHEANFATVKTISLSGNGALGINSHLSENQFSIYPNPSNGKFTITNPLINSSVVERSRNAENAITIYDITGKIVRAVRAKNLSPQEINLSNQPKGIYFIKIETEDSIFTEKIIIR